MAKDETQELMRLCVRALATQMWGAPGVELRMTRECVLGLTDEPLPDFNQMILGDDPDAEGFLRRGGARAVERGRPLVATMTPRVAPALGPIAAELGFAPVGTAPLMVLRPDTALPPLPPASRPIRIVRALEPAHVAAAGDLIASAFDTPRDVIARCIDACVTPTAGVETWLALAKEDGADEDGANEDGTKEGAREVPVSTVTVTPTGDTAGVTLMATPPHRQHRGWGRALLTAVIDDYRRRGVTRFHLGATDAGRPLYDTLGFVLVADLSVWVMGADDEV